MRNRLATFRVDIVPRGHGSGVVVSKEGHIVTAYHVVDGAERLEITMVDGEGKITTHQAVVVAADPDNDVAVIKVNVHFDRPAVLAKPEDVQPGDAVYNVGYPHSFGEMVGRGGVLRIGWNEDFDDMKVRDAILVDVKDGAGTSGSAVFNAVTGKVIGILTLGVWVGKGSSPPTMVNALQSMKWVRQMLDKAKVPYLNEFEEGAVKAQKALDRDSTVPRRQPKGDLKIIRIAPLEPVVVPRPRPR
jgi:hypothetical protein